MACAAYLGAGAFDLGGTGKDDPKHKKGVFGRFDLAALGGCHTLNVCYVML